MNGTQKVVVGAAGVAGAGAWVSYALLHKAAGAAKGTRQQLIDMKEGFSALAVAQKVALYLQFPIYPKSYFGVYDPVTRFSVADAVWQVWYDRAADLGAWDVCARLVRDLKTISEEIEARLGMGRWWQSSPTWDCLTSPNILGACLVKPNFEWFGDAARNTPALDFFTSLEAQQFWVTIVATAMELDARKLYNQTFWGYMTRALQGTAAEFNRLPERYGDAAAWAGEWAARAGAKIVSGLGRGIMAGLFSSALTPVIMTVALAGGGYYLYRRAGGGGGGRRLSPGQTLVVR